MDKKQILEKLTKIRLIVGSISILACILIIFLLFSIIKFIQLSSNLSKLNTHVATLESKLSSTTEELRASISNNHSILANALNQEQQNVGYIEQKLGNYSQQVGAVSNTVSTLQKLSKTDPELLAKYSKVFFLNENYAPSRISEIPEQFRYTNSKILKIQSDVLPYLQRMILDASTANNLIYVQSAYRSFTEQKSLKGQYSVVYGAGTANSFSADQGYSEHQLGTTVDLTTPGVGTSLDGFDKTDSYKWLESNAYRYGFVLSYPKNNKYYIYEPWHWRFVGVKLATDLHNQGKNFYDMDQRAIDEYLVSLFD